MKNVRMNTTRFAAILSLVFAFQVSSATAQDWTTSVNWVGYTYASGAAIQDPQDQSNNKSAFDLAFDPDLAPFSVQLAATPAHVYFRLQVSNIDSWAPGTYIIFISDATGSLLGKTYMTLTGNAGEIHVVNAANTIDQTTGSGSHASNIGGWARVETIAGTTHDYVDFQVPRDIFENTLGAVGPMNLKFYAGSSSGAGNVNNINIDWMTATTNSVPTAADFAGLGYSTLEGISNGASPLPVELTSFSAYRKADRVNLRWNTATETNNFGFEVERRNDDGAWTNIGFVAGHGNSNSPKRYDFDDVVAGMRGSISYRLKQIDRDGSTEYSSTVMVQMEDEHVELISAYPNPFNPTTTVNFSLATVSPVHLGLFDITGREVLNVIDGAMLDAGTHAQTINADGLASGRYLLILQTASGSTVHPVVLTK